MLKISTERTVDLLRQELEIQLEELKNKWHFSTLEKIFIREEMYIDFKLYSDRESLYKYMYDRFEPFLKSFVREVIFLILANSLDKNYLVILLTFLISTSWSENIIQE